MKNKKIYIIILVVLIIILSSFIVLGVTGHDVFSKYTSTNYGKYFEFDKNNKLDKSITGQDEYEIHANNYYVKYKVPNALKDTNYNSVFGGYKYDDSKGHIDVFVKVVDEELEPYIDSKNDYSIFYDYKNEDSKTSYFSDELKKINKNNYIYRVTYNEGEEDIYNEAVCILRKLDDNHYLSIEVDSIYIPISSKFIDNIKIENIEKYDEYLDEERNEKTVKFSMIKYETTTRDVKANIEIPSNYKQENNNNNLYTTRVFKDDKATIKYGFMNSIDQVYDIYKNDLEYYKDNGEVEDINEFNLDSENNKAFSLSYNDFDKKKNNLFVYVIPYNDFVLYVEVNSNEKLDINKYYKDLCNVEFEVLSIKK